MEREPKAANHVTTTLVSSHQSLDEFMSASEGQHLLTFDVEGVRLSRTGEATLAVFGVYNGLRVEVYIFDLLDETVDHFVRQMDALKNILEDPTVIKIIHDCRQESDVLNELFGIKLAGVFDTSVYGMIVSGSNSRDFLNTALGFHGCEVNRLREKPNIFFVENPVHWGYRPLTDDQIACASADVSSLFDLRKKLLSFCSMEMKAETQILSEKALDEFRSLRFLEDVDVPADRMGRVIGTGGCGIEKIRATSGATVNNCSAGGFRIMAKDKAGILIAKKMIVGKTSLPKLR
jgi:ribonuclease D